jgi:hypothetical protein
MQELEFYDEHYAWLCCYWLPMIQHKLCERIELMMCCDDVSWN